MRQVFQLREHLFGRPGPVYCPWNPDELAAGGIGAILSVNHGQSVYPDDLAKAGIAYTCLPMVDNAPPRPDDFELGRMVLPQTLDFIQQNIERGVGVLVHCTAGKDRTGLTLCHYLCQREGYTPQDALLEVRRVRPEAMSALEYEPFGLKLLSHLLENE